MLFSIKNNMGENLTRYDITAHIDDDASDGVGDVKLFCYDMLLLLQMKSQMRFLAHDSRLFSHMDARQCTTLFEIANKECQANGFQYIASMNENLYDALKAAKDFELEDIIESNIRLTLTDENDTTRLLGLQVNLDYS